MTNQEYITKLEEILEQNIAIRGFESINGDGEYFGNLDEPSVDKLLHDIQQLNEEAIGEATNKLRQELRAVIGDDNGTQSRPE